MNPLRVCTAALPAGKVKEDQFFGRTEMHRDRVRASVALSGPETTSEEVRKLLDEASPAKR